MRVRAGRFLPALDARRGAALAVLGPKVKRELFGEANALGQHVRIAGERFLVIGVMEPKGQFLGFDIDDSVYLPVGTARRLFNREALHEIDLEVANASLVGPAVEEIKRILRQRHGGEEDFTVTTQTGMLDSLGRILRMVSVAVGGIAAISLLVGAIGILTVMWISVHERTSEIGLAKALGATGRQIWMWFLAEAGMLGAFGGLLGLGVGMGLARGLHVLVPALPVRTPPEFVVLALCVSLGVGLLSGWLPARRAAALDPAQALTAE
jgi:putative ABC transport system permease protein